LRKPALVLALAAFTLAAISHVSAMSSPSAHASGAAYKVLQMNLCLSGEADCYERTAYPTVVEEAMAQVMKQAPSAVTLNEACSADAAEIAHRTGYRLRFAAVSYRGAPIPCVDPGGRGVFGLAVLTKDAISSSHDRGFAIQASGEEQRRWLCATTVRNVTVCTAHLSMRDSMGERVANDAECRELHDLLARRQRAGATVFGGDVNRQRTCAPATMGTSRDSAATQAAGIQHIYSGMPLNRSSLGVAAARYTDHDFLFAAGNHLPAAGRPARLP
jgi:hypothetical protein